MKDPDPPKANAAIKIVDVSLGTYANSSPTIAASSSGDCHHIRMR